MSHSEQLDFDLERRAALPQMAVYSSIIAIIGYIFFAIADQYVTLGSLTDILIIRGICVATLFVYLLVVRLRKPSSYVASAILLCICGFGVIALTFATHDPESRYLYVLGVVFVGWATFMPTTTFIAGSFAVVHVALYVGGALALHMTGSTQTFATNVAITCLWGFLGCCVVEVNNRLRFKEFLAARALRAKAEETERINGKLAAAVHELAISEEELRSLDRAKNDFFANINHELRTPLTMILARIQILGQQLAKHGHDGFVHHVDSCARSAYRLLNLVEGIVQLTRLDGHTPRMEPQPVDIGALAKAVAIDTEGMVKRKGLKVDVTLKDNTSSAVGYVAECDEKHIDRVFLNLLTNAVKFTDSGGTVSILVEALSDDVVVTIRDTGVGISAEAQEHIFERGYQEQDNNTAKAGGMGIGLYLVKLIITAHGGTITVDSAKGKGTAFQFRLPRKSTLTDTKRVASKPSLADYEEKFHKDYRLAELNAITDRRSIDRSFENKSGASILIVDDTRDLLELLADILNPEYRLYVATNGEEAMQLARRHRPELIISDIMMPKRTGNDLLRDIRADKELRQTPVVMVTASESQKFHAEADMAGVDGYISKPFDVNQVTALVKHLISRQSDFAAALLDSRDDERSDTARGVAHDILNSLHFLSGSFMVYQTIVRKAAPHLEDGLRTKLLTDSAEAYEAGMNGIARVEKNVKDLQHNADRAREREFEVASVNTCIENAVLETLRREHIDLTLKSTQKIPLQPGRIDEVIINLIKNASEAGGKDCRIAIDTWDSDDGVHIRVKDNGPGMDSETLSRAFEADFTTKKTGTGIGLTMSRKVVRDHGGNITVDSEEGHGATFSIWLPNKSRGKHPVSS